MCEKPETGCVRETARATSNRTRTGRFALAPAGYNHPMIAMLCYCQARVWHNGSSGRGTLWRPRRRMRRAQGPERKPDSDVSVIPKSRWGLRSSPRRQASAQTFRRLVTDGQGPRLGPGPGSLCRIMPVSARRLRLRTCACQVDSHLGITIMTSGRDHDVGP